ncbi:feline leukemia virus subgroup C receptor-related protein 2-like [Daphnia pulex]|uniref:feline leukemia virus subgroup C receptor-related protein 2-like n=1 Tax=Daphnia pulex TaxID=6669 RepID=UPI001EDD1630|nr:feline leukemia virus subgroup C receptor-related protein 2-like [Daphnia pulex]
MDKRKRYAVDKIIGIGKSQFGDTWYLVKWENYKKTTWVYDGDCDGCPNRIREFLEGFKGEPVPLRVTKPFSVEQRQRVEERRRREMGLGKQGLEEDTPEFGRASSHVHDRPNGEFEIFPKTELTRLVLHQLGVALGFFLPPILVKDHENIDDIGADLKLMFYIVAGVCTALFIVVVIGFQAKPPLPPNAARIAPQSSQPVTYYQSVKTIVTNKNYILLLITYGINAVVFYAMSTLLNQTVLRHFPGEEENAGRIGLTIVVCGMFGSVVCGIILDKTHKFRETTLVVYGLAVAGMVAYTFKFELQYIVITFVTAGAVGFFMTGYLPFTWTETSSQQ